MRVLLRLDAKCLRVSGSNKKRLFMYSTYSRLAAVSLLTCLRV